MSTHVCILNNSSRLINTFWLLMFKETNLIMLTGEHTGVYCIYIFYLELPLYNGGAYHQGRSSGASILYKTTNWAESGKTIAGSECQIEMRRVIVSNTNI